MNDHQTWKQVLEIIKRYEYPVVIVSATARTTRQLVEASKLAAMGNLKKAHSIADEVHERHQKLVNDFLNENPHQKNQLIKESCDKKVEEHISKLKKLLEYVYKQQDLADGMLDAIASIGEQISSYLLAQCGLALDMLTQFIDAKKIIKTDAEYGKATPNRALIGQNPDPWKRCSIPGSLPSLVGFMGKLPMEPRPRWALKGPIILQV